MSVAALADVFRITADLPNDFAGTPLLNNLNATFYAFIGDSRRGESDIDNLWDLFEAELALADADNPKIAMPLRPPSIKQLGSSAWAGNSLWGFIGPDRSRSSI